VRADGTPVMVEGMFGCGACEFCLEGRNNLCAQAARKALGIRQDGGMVEQYRVPAHKLIELPHGPSFEVLHWNTLKADKPRSSFVPRATNSFRMANPTDQGSPRSAEIPPLPDSTIQPGV
jgi:hypothetical protein